ncbi:ciliary microtubule inner protein 1 isoform X2 [Hyperolius riggenbachi]|uniref:ciliary microtubule inner protein 1 isoform X2 n=1 Tax=Hyperolius riggenbachi TaxID=752182 RepID=UPI0035A2F9E6
MKFCIVFANQSTAALRPLPRLSCDTGCRATCTQPSSAVDLCSVESDGCSPAKPVQAEQLRSAGHDLVIPSVCCVLYWKAHIKKELETTKRWPEDWGFLTMPCDEVDPSPAVPPTTQGLVGWRSSVPKHALERYGKTNYLKGDFCKRMNWPAEGIA